MTTKDPKLVHCDDVSKTSVSFSYQLKLLCDVLSWSFSLKCQLIRRLILPVRRRKDVSNKSVSSTHQLRRLDDALAWSETSQPI